MSIKEQASVDFPAHRFGWLIPLTANCAVRLMIIDSRVFLWLRDRSRPGATPGWQPAPSCICAWALARAAWLEPAALWPETCPCGQSARAIPAKCLRR